MGTSNIELVVYQYKGTENVGLVKVRQWSAMEQQDLAGVVIRSLEPHTIISYDQSRWPKCWSKWHW